MEDKTKKLMLVIIVFIVIYVVANKYLSEDEERPLTLAEQKAALEQQQKQTKIDVEETRFETEMRKEQEKSQAVQRAIYVMSGHDINGRVVGLPPSTSDDEFVRKYNEWRAGLGAYLNEVYRDLKGLNSLHSEVYAPLMIYTKGQFEEFRDAYWGIDNKGFKGRIDEQAKYKWNSTWGGDRRMPQVKSTLDQMFARWGTT